MNYLKLFGIAAFSIGAILYLASADDHEIIIGDQDFDLGEFSRISVNTADEVRVTVGEGYALNVKGDEKDVDKIKLYVKGQTLVIEDKRALMGHRDRETLEISVALPLLKKFTLNSSANAVISDVHGSLFKVVVNGSGNVDFTGSADDFRAEVNGSGALSSTSFDIKEGNLDINGSGKVYLEGACNALEIDVNGSGEFDGRNFKCKKVEVDIAGSGDLKIYASKAIDIDVVGSGDIIVFGNPEKIKDHSGKQGHVTIR